MGKKNNSSCFQITPSVMAFCITRFSLAICFLTKAFVKVRLSVWFIVQTAGLLF